MNLLWLNPCLGMTRDREGEPLGRRMRDAKAVGEAVVRVDRSLLDAAGVEAAELRSRWDWRWDQPGNAARLWRSLPCPTRDAALSLRKNGRRSRDDGAASWELEAV